MKASTPRKILATLLVLTLMGAVTGGATVSALQSNTESTGNSFAAGSVGISDNDGASALYSVSGLEPGQGVEKCIKVTYKEPHGEGRLITHRVKTVQALQGKVRFTTQGDANDTSEHWQVATTGQIARVTHRVPKLGYGLGFLRDPEKRLFLLAIPALLLGLFELVRIWRPSPEPQGSS